MQHMQQETGTIRDRLSRAFWLGRTILAAAAIVALCGILLTWPHPHDSWRIWPAHALVLVIFLPLIVMVVALLSGWTRAERIIPRVGHWAKVWIPLTLFIMIYLAFGRSSKLAFMGVAAFSGALAFPLLVATRDPRRIALLRRLVTGGLVLMATVWLIASFLLSHIVNTQADRLAAGRPFCLTAPVSGSIRQNENLGSDTNMWLLQRMLAYRPYDAYVGRYRLQLWLRDASGIVQSHHWSFGAFTFLKDGEHQNAPCDITRYASVAQLPR